MAVIDFPTSPINGQIFNAPNGVTYRWQSTPAPGLWLSGSGVASVSAGTTPPATPAPNALWWNSDAITGGGQLYVYYNDGNTTQWVPAATGSLPTTPGGDFFAVGSGGSTATGAQTVIAPGTVYTGNSGSWYNNGTGRFTPPAGRYSINIELNADTAGSGTTTYLQIWKNGVSSGVTTSETETSGSRVCLVVGGIFDTNGTDYFEMRAQSVPNAAVIAFASFGAFPLSGIKGPPGDPGAVIQTVSYQTGAVATGTTVMPWDDTIPQIGEGNEYMTCTITPRSATSKLIIDVVCVASSSNGTAHVTVALFQDATANALACVTQYCSAPSIPMPLNFKHTMTSGTTSATTFRVRAGANAAATTTFNGAVGARLFGGTMASSIVIQEVL